MTRAIIPAFILATLAAAAIGFGASHFLDNGTLKKLEADRDQARDCRNSGATLAPCPVEYKNTKIVWRTKVETKPTPDPRQAERISALSANLADAQRTIRDLRDRMALRQLPPPAFNYYLQNGSMAHPYNTADHCPAGATVIYAASPSTWSRTGRRSGDPNVCYVRIVTHRSSM